MKRRAFITLLGGAAAALSPFTAEAQPERMRRIGMLQSGGGGQDKEFLSAFRDALADLGWVEGRNLQVDRRTSMADFSRARAFAKELVGSKPDLIVATSAQMVQFVQEASGTIPVVFVNVPDTVVGDLAGGVSRPTRNATGFINFNSTMAGKWLELLKEMVSGLSGVGVLLHTGNATAPGYLRAIEAAAAALSIKLRSEGASRTSDIEPIVARFSGRPGSGLVVPPSSLATANQDSIVALTAKHRLPAIYPYPEFVRSGGLVSYGFDRIDSYRKTAMYVDRILRGATPNELPVQAPDKFQLVVNLKTAKALGLTIPESFLLRADEMIE